MTWPWTRRAKPRATAPSPPSTPSTTEATERRVGDWNDRIDRIRLDLAEMTRPRKDDRA